MDHIARVGPHRPRERPSLGSEEVGPPSSASVGAHVDPECLIPVLADIFRIRRERKDLYPVAAVGQRFDDVGQYRRLQTLRQTGFTDSPPKPVKVDGTSESDRQLRTGLPRVHMVRS
jgi:hypothetical protein